MRSVMPIFVIPLIGTFFVGGLMVWVVGKPVAVLMVIMKAWLTGLGTGNLVVLAVILGLMMSFDMGGPVNKVAYSFGVAMVGTISLTTHMASPIALRIMACIGVADCTPPLAMGLASMLRPKKYTVEERAAGKAGILMGLMGITEGAIPFAAADPLRVIPSIMVGSASGSVVAMLLGAENPAPWGGWIVLPVVTGRAGYIIGTAVGVAVTVLLVNFLKKPIAEKTDLKAGHDEKNNELKIEIQE
jgi:fructose-specific phosphotransferase system IIC component